MRAFGAAFGVLGLLLVVGIIGYLLVGIGGPAAPPAPPRPPADGDAPPPRTPRTGYTGRLLDAGDHVQVQSQLTAVRSQVQFFEAEHGRFPASLDELAKQTGRPLPALPSGMSWIYDPTTGNVGVQ